MLMINTENMSIIFYKVCLCSQKQVYLSLLSCFNFEEKILRVVTTDKVIKN